MKKAIVIIIAVVITAILLVPVPLHLKDGGTVVYQAVLYSVSDVHSLNPDEPDGYDDGTIIKILGFEIYNSVE
ncbi:MAG: hypothetical protein J5992_10335 [Oscillospiraceae bacterium]|nr:hypothetical protein [Oscillospiraceae bacterium]